MPVQPLTPKEALTVYGSGIILTAQQSGIILEQLAPPARAKAKSKGKLATYTEEAYNQTLDLLWSH
jgi:nitrous oxidase accessory protein NosD